MTFNEHVQAALELAEQARQEAYDRHPSPGWSEEARDLSLAITHLEDALTRYNSSRYRRLGEWERRDPDIRPGA